MPTSRRKRSYLVYFPETGKVMKHRVVKFRSKSVNTKHTQTGSLLCDEDDFMLLRRSTNPDMCSAADFNRSEKILGEQAENTNPDMCSAADVNRPENISGEQTEKLVTEDKPDGNPQTVTEGARYPTRETRCPAYLNDDVMDLDKVVAESDHILSSVDHC